MQEIESPAPPVAGAAMIFVHGGTEPVPATATVALPHVAMIFRVGRGGLDELVTSPLLLSCIHDDIPAIAVMADADEAFELQRRVDRTRTNGLRALLEPSRPQREGDGAELPEGEALQ